MNLFEKFNGVNSGSSSFSAYDASVVTGDAEIRADDLETQNPSNYILDNGIRNGNSSTCRMIKLGIVEAYV